MSHYTAHKDINNGTLKCPLCQQTFSDLDGFLKHVAYHQGQLALFALPSTENESESEPEMGSDVEANPFDEANLNEGDTTPKGTYRAKNTRSREWWNV
jgi:hypothetical protein